MPAKGTLAANTTILSLFLDGPETQSTIRKRLSQEYGDAQWSRSVVDYAIPTLVGRGLILKIQSGTKPAHHIYEITESGIDVFRGWMRDSARAPAPMREPLQLWIEHSTHDELPLLLAVIRESELAAFRQMRVVQERLANERAAGKLGLDWNGTVLYAMLADRVMYWQQRAARCQQMRTLLVGKRNKHKQRPGGERA